MYLFDVVKVKNLKFSNPICYYGILVYSNKNNWLYSESAEQNKIMLLVR